MLLVPDRFIAISTHPNSVKDWLAPLLRVVRVQKAIHAFFLAVGTFVGETIIRVYAHLTSKSYDARVTGKSDRCALTAN